MLKPSFILLYSLCTSIWEKINKNNNESLFQEGNISLLFTGFSNFPLLTSNLSPIKSCFPALHPHDHLFHWHWELLTHLKQRPFKHRSCSLHSATVGFSLLFFSSCRKLVEKSKQTEKKIKIKLISKIIMFYGECTQSSSLLEVSDCLITQQT